MDRAAGGRGSGQRPVRRTALGGRGRGSPPTRIRSGISGPEIRSRRPRTLGTDLARAAQVGRRGAAASASLLARSVEIARALARWRRDRRIARAGAPWSEGRRLKALAIGLAALAVWDLVVLTRVQIVDPDRYRRLAQDQSAIVRPIQGLRGSLYDRRGEALALSMETPTIVADPSKVTDPRGALAILTRHLAPRSGVPSPARSFDPASVSRALGKKTSRFAYVARQVPPEVADAIVVDLNRAGIEGFSTENDQRRIRPAEDSARSLVGSVDLDGNGVSGVELMLNDQLRGIAGRAVTEHAVDGATIVDGRHVLQSASRGADVDLTIDSTLQFEAERALVAQVTATGAQGGTVIVGVPDSGELLAVATVQRDRKTGEVAATSYNSAFAASYEPGSVIKAITGSAALQERLIGPLDRMVVPASLRVADKTYTDHDHDGPVRWRLADIIAHSSNVGIVGLARRLGADKVAAYLRAFGFGRPTPIGFPREQGGLLSAPDGWAPTQVASIAFGQGVSATPAQLWAAYNVFANGGVYVAPRLIRRIRQADGAGREPTVPRPRRVLRSDAAQAMAAALEEVVRSGTGSHLRIPGFDFAGKTGTAYKWNNATGSYTFADGRHYVATFAGFLPVSNPRFTIVALLDEPRRGHTGADAAGPVFEAVGAAAARLSRLPAGVDRAGSVGVVRAEPATPPPTTPPPTTPPPTTPPPTTPPPTTPAPKAGSPTPGAVQEGGGTAGPVADGKAKVAAARGSRPAAGPATTSPRAPVSASAATTVPSTATPTEAAGVSAGGVAPPRSATTGVSPGGFRP